jgi:hypothetical protein
METEKLIERFFEGDTSNDEEQALYAFFDSDDIPEHLAKYRQIFRYFANGIRNDRLNVQVVPPRRRSRLRTAAVAAAVLLLAVGGLCLHNRLAADSEYADYEVVVNGVRLTDADEIKAAVERIHVMAAAHQLEVMSPAESNAKHAADILGKIADERRNVLSKIEDENVRRATLNLFINNNL